LELELLSIVHFPLGDDKKVDVAVLVGVPDREGALEVGTDVVLAQDLARAGDKLGQNVVQVGELGRVRQ
jgi:hypothetical protein